MEERPEADQLEQNLRLFNNVSSGLFYATAIAGILDAQLRYVPVHRETRERPLPPELETDYDPTLEVGISPLGASLKLRF